MKSILLMASSLVLTSAVMAEEVPNAANGQKLFNESRCLECHGVDLFTSKDRKVKNLTGLESMVRRCDANLSTNWFDDQILDVVEYLNKAYYKFEKTPKQSNNTNDAKPDETIVVTEDAEKKVVVANTESD